LKGKDNVWRNGSQKTLFGETVVKRLLIDKEFKKGLEKEIVDAILKEEYYMAHIMLKDLVEYKERRNTGG
jgi:hypothetical protein